MTNCLVSWRLGILASWLPSYPNLPATVLIPSWEATGRLSLFTPTWRDQGEAQAYRVLRPGRDKDPQRAKVEALSGELWWDGPPQRDPLRGGLQKPA